MAGRGVPWHVSGVELCPPGDAPSGDHRGAGLRCGPGGLLCQEGQGGTAHGSQIRAHHRLLPVFCPGGQPDRASGTGGRRPSARHPRPQAAGHGHHGHHLPGGRRIQRRPRGGGHDAGDRGAVRRPPQRAVPLDRGGLRRGHLFGQFPVHVECHRGLCALRKSQRSGARG